MKLRQTTTITASGPLYRGIEEIVPLLSLPSLLLERLGSLSDVNAETTRLSDVSNQQNAGGETSTLPAQSSVDVECIYVGADGYFDNEHRVNSAQWKHIKKVMKTSGQKMASHLMEINESTPVVAIDLPFRVIRDVGSSLILDGIDSLNSSEIASKFPEHKKKFRNLMYALDGLARKDHSPPQSIFLYSIPCDKYDLITITTQ